MKPEPMVGVRDLRARLSAYLRSVSRGASITIGNRRRQPVARLVPVEFPTRLGGIAPNLDVVLYGCDGSLVAIESKFTEPFIKSKTKCFLKPK